MSPKIPDNGKHAPLVPFDGVRITKVLIEAQKTDVIESPQKSQKIIGDLINGVRSSLSRVMNLEQMAQNLQTSLEKAATTIRQLKEGTEADHAMARRNQEIYQKLHAINVGIYACNTLFDAIMYVEEAFQEQFPEVSVRIMLAPVEASDGTIWPNPIAQMLADTVEIWRDHVYADPKKGEAERERLRRLIRLLPIVEGAIPEKDWPDELWYMDLQQYRTMVRANPPSLDAAGHMMVPNPEIFGTDLGSALFEELEWIGTIAFLSKDPNYYSRDVDTLILRSQLQILAKSIALIGKKETNEKDAVTGLPMRRHLTQKASSILREDRSSRIPTSFVILDLDHFKHVNDTYGHAAWDFVLKTFWSILMSKLNGDDVKVRWGGEEFAVLMRASPKDAANAIGRVAKALEVLTFGQEKNGSIQIINSTTNMALIERTFKVTFSAGVEGIDLAELESIGDDAVAFKMLEKKADDKLYMAKHTWRNRIVWQAMPNAASTIGGSH